MERFVAWTLAIAAFLVTYLLVYLAAWFPPEWHSWIGIAVMCSCAMTCTSVGYALGARER